MRYRLGPLSIDFPEGWVDITDTESPQVNSTPWTMAREDGKGALQFSVALYAAGTVPNATVEELSSMLFTFGAKHHLGLPSEIETHSESIKYVAGSFLPPDQYLRCWQISDGLNFCFATYTSLHGRIENELIDCSHIVKSIIFR
jgi:hypothetical protein